MTNKTINGVPRDALWWAIKQLAEDGNAGCGYFDSLTALLAAPDPIVEADGIGEPMAWEVSNAGVVGLTRRASGANAYRDAGWVVSPLYSADQLAALQSTIAQLKAENESLLELKQHLTQLREIHGFESWASVLVEVDKLKAENERLRGERGVELAPSREMRMYIAGPMTGIENYNFPAFNAMAEQMRAAGWHVENPADHGVVAGADWADYLRYDLSRLSTCKAVMLLPGWTSSNGAKLEVSVAKKLGATLMFSEGAEDEPMPVTVKLPERGGISNRPNYNDGWNACLDEVRRINP